MRPFLTVLIIATLVSPLSALASETLAKARTALENGRYGEARGLLSPLAEKGDPEALLRLGIMYYHGQGVPENEKRAVELLTQSANRGNVEAMYQLGNAYAFGSTTQSLVTDADVEAARWYFNAANAGNSDAQYALGLLFLVGKGVEKSLDDANQWMSRAAKGGHIDAQKYIGTNSK